MQLDKRLSDENFKFYSDVRGILQYVYKIISLLPLSHFDQIENCWYPTHDEHWVIPLSHLLYFKDMNIKEGLKIISKDNFKGNFKGLINSIHHGWARYGLIVWEDKKLSASRAKMNGLSVGCFITCL